MMRILFSITFCLAVFNNYAQKMTLQLQGGTANYQGDLQELPYTLESSGAHIGLNFLYNINNHIALRAGGAFGKIKAADQASSKKGNRARNLSFENKIFEFNIGAEYNLFNLEQRIWSPYVFAGIGVYTHNPYAFDASGKKQFLEPLSTEGQGLPEYPNRPKYKLNGISIPIGGGLRVQVNENVNIGYEIGFRKTFTDYIDDVSTTYPDEVKLLNRKGLNAVAMSYRGGEVFGGVAAFPAENFLRGSAKNKDWYYFQAITIGLNLFQKDGGLFGGNNKYRTKCPKF